MLDAILAPGSIFDSYVQSPNQPDNDTRETISGNYRFWPYFQNCLGALDGTHVAAVVKESLQFVWRCRKGCVCQNVLGVCRLSGKISFVLSGYEGSAHDGTVLGRAMRAVSGAFSIPAGFYYLADAGYGLCPWLLTPYRGVRYHLKEWAAARQRCVMQFPLCIVCFSRSFSARPCTMRACACAEHTRLCALCTCTGTHMPVPAHAPNNTSAPVLGPVAAPENSFPMRKHTPAPMLKKRHT